MIITLQNNTKFTEIGQSKENLMALRFLLQILNSFSLQGVSGIVGMISVLVKFYFWHHKSLSYKKY